MNESKRQIKDALLERYLADDLRGDAKGALERLLESSEADQARLAELRAESKAFLTSHPAGPLVARFESQPGRRPSLLQALVAATAAAALAAFAILVSVKKPEPDFSPKGGVALTLYKKQGDRAVKVEPGTTLAAGDEIRFEVRATRSGQVAVVSRDFKGAVTVYYPFGGMESAPYEVGSPLLPTAVSLDGVSGPEEIYAVLAPQAFSLQGIVEALQSNKPIEGTVPAGASVTRTELTKQ